MQKPDRVALDALAGAVDHHRQIQIDVRANRVGEAVANSLLEILGWRCNVVRARGETRRALRA